MANLADEIESLAVQQTIVNLVEAGVDVNFIDLILERLGSAVGAAENIDDLIDELEVLLISTPEKKSILQRYISQVSSDSITQFNATHSQALVQGTDIQFYYYDGTRIKETRPFCLKHQQKYYHEKEVNLLGAGIEITGDPLNQNQLKGRINPTTPSNIFTNRGGWNCRHQFVPVSIFSVPKKVIIRALNKGYLELTKEQKTKLGI